MNWYPIATKDPIPGDPADVAVAAKNYTDVAAAISRTQSSLETIAEMDGLQAKSVEKLRERALKVRENIGKAERRYREVGEALSTYGTAHRQAQDDAETLRTKAVAKQKAVDEAEVERVAAQKAYDAAVEDLERDETPIPWAVSNRRNVAVATKKRLDTELQELIDSLPAVISRWNSAAATAKAAIEKTVRTDDLKDSHWDNWGRKLAKIVSEVAGTVAGIAGIAALVLAWVPVLGPALGVVALVAGLAALVADIVLLANGEGSWGDVLIGLLGAASFGVGRFVGSAAKSLAAAASTKGAKRAERTVEWLAENAGSPTRKNLKVEDLLDPQVPSLLHPAPQLARPSTWNTWFHQGVRSFKGLSGRAAWLNFMGHPDAARALQALNKAEKVDRAFARGTAYKIPRDALATDVVRGTYLPLVLDVVGAGHFAGQAVKKGSTPDLPARQVLNAHR